MGNKNIKRQVLAGVIVFSMILSGMIMITNISPKVEARWQGGNTQVPTVRIYGEKDAPYPTHMLTGSNDFIYPNMTHPFDPGVIPKDSITFNSAFIDGHNNPYNGDIKVDGGNDNEKVFLRLFYEPGYQHDKDPKMNYNDLESVGPFDAIITETTYMLIDDYGYPVAGGAGSTKFFLPYSNSNPNRPGMDSGGIVRLAKVEPPGDLCEPDGCIWVEKSFTIKKGETVNFMDHNLTFKYLIHSTDNVNLYSAVVDISYTGNMHNAVDKVAKNDTLIIGIHRYHPFGSTWISYYFFCFITKCK